MFRHFMGAGLAALIATTILGQSATSPFAFEVASIKPHQGPLRRMFVFSSSGPRADYEGFPVIGLVMEAYNVESYQVTFAKTASQPEMTYYNIAAKAEGDRARSRNEFRRMLQSLLIERFKLTIHREMQEKPIYALIVGKNGPKLKASPPQNETSAHLGVNGRNQIWTASKTTTSALAGMLRQGFGIDLPVLDKTGLTGDYDFKIEATPEFRIKNNEELGDISIFSAVQEQLGLKLESQKAMMEIIVIDRVEKPSEN